MQTWEIKSSIEALLFSSSKPLTVGRLAAAAQLSPGEVEQALKEIDEELSSVDRGVMLVHRASGVRLETKPQWSDAIKRLYPERSGEDLTYAARETLAVIARSQPVSVRKVTSVRGVDSTAVIATLHRKRLIARAGREGKEVVWMTTPLFLEMFGLARIEDILEDASLERVLAEEQAG